MNQCYQKSWHAQVIDLISDEFYDQIQAYLYQHYDNFKDRIESELIKKITEEFIENPKNHKFSDLRKKIFTENKELLTKVLQDEVIFNNVEDIIIEYTRKEYHFNWRWMNGIAEVIKKNWNLFKDDKNINQSFGREIERLTRTIKCLEEKISDIKAGLDD